MGVSIGFGVGPVRVSKRIGGGRRRRGGGSSVGSAVGGLVALDQMYRRRQEAKAAEEEQTQQRAFADNLDKVAEAVRVATEQAGRPAFYEAYNAEMARSGDRHVARAAGSAAYKLAADLAAYQTRRDLADQVTDPVMEAKLADRDGFPESAKMWRATAEQQADFPTAAQDLVEVNSAPVSSPSGWRERLDARAAAVRADNERRRADLAARKAARSSRRP